MKDLPYLKTIYADKDEIFMVDYNGTNTDIYKAPIKLDNDISDATDENIYKEFLENIDSLNYSEIPLLYKKTYDIDLDNEKSVKTVKNLIKSGFEFLQGKSLLGDPDFIIIHPDIYEKMKPFIDKMTLNVVHDSNLPYILIGIKNTWNQPGLLLYFNGLNYSIEQVGYLPQNQYLRIHINI